MPDEINNDRLARGLRAFEAKLNPSTCASLNSCVHCGLCADSCHYFLATGDPKMQPAYKVGLVQSVYKRYNSTIGKHLPFLIGAKDLDHSLRDEWLDCLFGACSGCSRCTLNCTVGLNIPQLVRAGRSALTALGLAPSELQSTVENAVATGNNMGICRTEWLETIDWLNEELQAELGTKANLFPMDVPQADYLYTVNPREIKFFPLSLMAAAKVFYAAKENWTFSADHFDVTNYGLFNGDDLAAATIHKRHSETMQKLGCRSLILGECGHGYVSGRWEGPQWISERPDYSTVSIVSILAGYLREKRITLDQARITKRVTLHDPCNLVRMGGVIEDQRYVLRQAVSDFVEMTPNREQNFCCGGGGGQLSMTRFAKRRIEAGKIKADQIRATGAAIVVAPCHNCIDQLSELNKEYKLGVEVKTLTEIVAATLEISDK